MIYQEVGEVSCRECRIWFRQQQMLVPHRLPVLRRELYVVFYYFGSTACKLCPECNFFSKAFWK